MEGMDRILELQALDTTIDRLQARRRQLEEGEEVRVARSSMEQAEGALGEIRLALDAVARDQQRLEHEIDSMTQKAAAEEKRLYDGSIANTKELEALQHEIASIRDRRSRTEDRLLDQMEQREALEDRAGAAETELGRAREQLEALGGSAAEELRSIEEDLSRRSSEREGLLPAFDRELLDLYEEIRAQKKGVAVARLVDGVCQACHEQLSAMEIDRLKRTQDVRRCEYCRRLLIVG
ncbi:MAG TPA: YscO family type III secretion system apparatus protein [Actinomycetota bacterium]|jgi:predicted  nucleic acid-binding Zn-ribbon protein|nr:YscO family type III secretion system apparatus protein [Actinomycetota bacterium]